MIEEVDIVFNYGAFTSKFGFKEVQQLLVTGPSGTYYVIEDNDGIKTLQYLFSKDFKDHEDSESSHERNKKARSQKSRSRAGKNSTCSATVKYEIEASPQQFQTQQSTAYGPEIGNEEDPALRPMVISETETRMEKRSRIFEGIGSRKIVFKGDARGISTPSDLPYSPKKTTWKGKKAATTDQLQAEVKKKKVKQMAMKGKWPVDTNDYLV
uniref:Transposon MuDR mudrA n=1 Tax=Solanum tuberosum TaxID=4113 RepID=M1BVF2_SOLTU